MVTEVEIEAAAGTMSRLMYRYEGNFSTVDWKAVVRDVLTAAAAARPVQAEAFNFDVFERAAEIMAMWIARFRSGDPCDETPNENDRLTAGHLAGALAANNLLAEAVAHPAPSVKEVTELLRTKMCGPHQECDDAHDCICREGARAVIEMFAAAARPAQAGHLKEGEPHGTKRRS